MTPPAARILIADDEQMIRSGLESILRSEGYEVFTVPGGANAVETAEREGVHLALVDLTMPDLSGIEVLKRMKKRLPETRVIIITAYASAETAVQAMKLGALDYLIKPFSTDELKLQVRRALREMAVERENEALRMQVARDADNEMVGKAPGFLSAVAMARRTAKDTVTVLITGETGTGKELVAREVHRASKRSGGPFLALNCAAVPDTMLERELFGHEKGAFTGADLMRPGLIEASADGTMFLDEIGEMPLALQVKLLRIIDGQDFMRLGGTRPVKVHSRFVVATNRNLARLVKEGKFREDLYHRLNIVNVALPPLRDRGNDVVLLTKYFLDRFCLQKGCGEMKLADSAEKKLRAYRWPGNVRELKNVMERAVILNSGKTLDAGMLVLDGPAGTGGDQPDWSGLSLKDARDSFEKSFITRALADCGRNVSKTAERIGLDRKNLEDKLRKYRLK